MLYDLLNGWLVSLGIVPDFFSNFKNSCVKKWQAVAKKWQAVAIFLPFEKLDCGLKYFIMTTNHEISLQTAVDMTNRYLF